MTISKYHVVIPPGHNEPPVLLNPRWSEKLHHLNAANDAELPDAPQTLRPDREDVYPGVPCNDQVQACRAGKVSLKQ